MDGDSGYTEVDPKELISLCAVDSELFCRTFFPKAFRQESPTFAPDFWRPLDDPDKHFVSLLMFRGSSKTTRLRAFIAKRIAYGISRTVLYVCASQAKARANIRWLKRQIEYNTTFSATFDLRKGSKWSDDEIEIHHGIEDHPITVSAFGIEGPVRGINFDDYRPDLIAVDDVLDEENSATKDQRDKMESLIFGALLNGLAPVSEAPDAKFVTLNTPLNREDYSIKAKEDPSIVTVEFSCWSKETRDLPLDQQESSWPARWTSVELRAKKRQYLHRNQLSIWLREMEVTVVSRERSVFRADWLHPWETLPRVLTHVLVIDPVPPPSAVAVKQGKIDGDFEALGVVGVGQGRYFVREVSVNRGHDPGWTISEFFRLCRKYRMQRVIVETVAYQRVLKWILSEAMKREKTYYRIDEYNDASRSKYNRIVDSLNGPASEGVLFIPPPNDIQSVSEGMMMFIQQFNDYSQVNHDDALEVVAIGVAALANQLDVGDPDTEVANDDEENPALEYEDGALCP